MDVNITIFNGCGYQCCVLANPFEYFTVGNYGYHSGLTFSQSLDYGSYCTRYPRDCSDYFSLMLGHNSYYGNHIFATVSWMSWVDGNLSWLVLLRQILLFLLLISYAVSTFFSYRTWKVFKRDMTNGKVSLKPSKWARLRFRMSEIKKPNLPAWNIRERFVQLRELSRISSRLFSSGALQGWQVVGSERGRWICRWWHRLSTCSNQWEHR